MVFLLGFSLEVKAGQAALGSPNWKHVDSFLKFLSLFSHPELPLDFGYRGIQLGILGVHKLLRR